MQSQIDGHTLGIEADARPGTLADARPPLRAPARLELDPRPTPQSVSGDAVAMADGAGRIVFINEAAEKLTGWSLADAHRRPLWDVLVIGDTEAVSAPDEAPAHGGPAAGPVDLGATDVATLIARDGGQRHVEFTAVSTRDGHDGVADLQLVVFRDLAAREAVEARLLASEQLHQRKDDFLAELGHELRGPLAPICSALQILRRHDRWDPMLEQAYAIIERQVARLTGLIEEMSDLSRMRAGTLRLALRTDDLRTVVRAALETCRPAFERRQQQVALDLPAHPVAALVDAARIEQAISNLLINASRYSHPGDRIVLTLTDTDAIRITVTDPGIGIEAQMLPQVFDLYARSERAAQLSSEGLGIGLALVRRIATLHGGSASASSDGPGQGARFTITLPSPITVPGRDAAR